MALGNNFGNKGVVSPQTLVIPIDLAEAVRFELTEVVKLRRFSRPVHSTALPRFLWVEASHFNPEERDFEDRLKNQSLLRLEIHASCLVLTTLLIPPPLMRLEPHSMACQFSP